MKRIFQAVLLILFFVALANPAYSVGDVSQGTSAGEFLKVGAAGAQFLKIGPGARANGMAGAYASVASDLTSIYWNPAGLADIKGMGANFSYTQWFGGFSHNYAAASMPIGDFTAALSFTSFSSGRIPITTLEQPEGTGSYYSINDFAIGATIGGYLTDQFSFGITAKYIRNGFASLSSAGFAFDVGTMYQTGIQGIKLGFSIHNLGTQQEYSGQDLKTTRKLYEGLYASPLDVSYLSSPYSIPLMFRAGASADIINVEEHKLMATGEFLTISDTPEQFAVGLEYTWNNLLSVRGGYRIGQDQFGLAGGVGINYIGGGFKGQFDYSINPTKDLGLVNRISIDIILD